MYVNDFGIYTEVIYKIETKRLNNERLTFKERYFETLVESLIDGYMENSEYGRYVFEGIVSEINKDYINNDK
ncbi:hypothetical protein QI298_09895 [Staphylococcus saprophyticus]|nr:hypothetical protein [Staphylococcus saprophyticus]MDW4066491.1 hypothetical protein [Staphylococcus saprophyticus]MDW4137152.1 hypothetical protein [Staphylococcus saprophyticus]MDW4349952.1 hypothetical protein [Staphylococcus saprophyticus]